MTTKIHAWGAEFPLLRSYAILAYAIQEFRGLYDNELLRMWWYPDGTTSTACGGPNRMEISSGDGWICMNNSTTKRKFVMAHEYGHVNLYLGIATTGQPSNCTKDGFNGHGMHAGRSEWNSCAAMEGWANFVAVDIWNDNIHNGGSPEAHLRYWQQTNEIISADAGSGGCASSSADSDPDFRTGYADTCYVAGWDATSHCATGDCDQVGNELDWMRAWWDYHTDDSHFSGGTVGHTQLHLDIQEAIPWGDTIFWQEFTQALSGLSATRYSRFNTIADVEGVSEP